MRGSVFLISFLFTLAPPKASTKPKKPLRVIGGSDVVDEEKQYRYIVSIVLSYNNHTLIHHVCTGAVITPTWTLTAFHCEIEKTDEVFPVILYFNNADYNYNDTTKYNVQYFVHPPSTKAILGVAYVNDIALAKTDPIKIAIYGKLCAVDYKSLYGQEVDVFGYGDMNNTQNENEGQMVLDTAVDLKNPLQTAKAMIYDCHEHKKLMIIERSLVCLGFACNRQSIICSGDSGGPIVHPRGGIVAIVQAVPLNSICVKNLNEDLEVVRPTNTAYATLVEPNLSWIMNRLKED